VTGELEKNPALVGYFNIDEVRPTDEPVLGRCTAHVFDIHEQEKIMTVAWYNEGAHILDISGLTGITIGGTPISGDGVKEIGSARFAGSDTWSAKTPRIHPVKGDFYLYSNDVERGLDIWQFRGDGTKPSRKGRWMTGSEAQGYFAANAVSLPGGYQLFCLGVQ